MFDASPYRTSATDSRAEDDLTHPIPTQTRRGREQRGRRDGTREEPGLKRKGYLGREKERIEARGKKGRKKGKRTIKKKMKIRKRRG